MFTPLVKLNLSQVSTIDYSRHWKPWFNMAEPCQIKYDHIVYIEDMDKEFTDLKDVIAEEPESVVLDGPSTVYNNAEIIAEYRNIDKNLLENVYNIFKEDFIIGDYDKNTECINTTVSKSLL